MAWGKKNPDTTDKSRLEPNQRQIAKRPAATLPAPEQQQTAGDLELGSIDLGSGFVIRVLLTSYKGRRLISIRRWSRTPERLLPQRQGINLGVEHLPELSRLVHLADKRARK